MARFGTRSARTTSGGLTCLVAWGVLGTSAEAQSRPGTLLSDLTWVEAEAVLGPESIVVIPLGAQSKEHGPHLRLDNDFVMAVDVVPSLAGYGPRRFYVLNTGVSTIRPLRASAEVLASEGILLRFTDILEVAGEAEAQVREQERGTHADEIETSMMLYIAPDRVDMRLAVREDNEWGRGGLTRDPDGSGTYSASGAWGDPTLASREKGRIVVEATVAGILEDLAALAVTPNPDAAAGR